MLNIFKMSLRNVGRNKRRTVITVAMIAFGMIVTLLYKWVFRGNNQ